MSQVCPHCGVHLPDVQDAFCPECRNPLDELPADLAAAQKEADTPLYSLSGISGMEGMSWEEVITEVEQGGRLIRYKYCISIGYVTVLEPSKLHLIRKGESVVFRGLPYIMLSLLAGWWGFPWGFIYTPLAVFHNLGGGEDVTDAVQAMQAFDMDR